MKPSRLTYRSLGLCVLAAMVTGCGASPIPLRATTILPGAVRAASQPSWFEPQAGKIKKLLYVSDEDSGVVHVYDYATAAEVARLTGFANPEGECVDATGDVFIVDFAYTWVAEYAHGGHKRLQTLKTGGSPTACAVAPDGDLAVANNHTPSGQGNIVIFPHANGKPVTYSNSDCTHPIQPAYDSKNNLYVQAWKDYSSEMEVCELPHSGKVLRTVQVNASFSGPSGVMWDGKYITLTDYHYNSSQAETIIYQMKEAKTGDLSVAGQTTLTDTSCSNRNAMLLPFIVGASNTPINKQQGTAVVGINGACSSLELWGYPGGGDPSKKLKQVEGHSYGEAVSIAQ